MIKRNESDVGDIVFEILAKTVFKLFYFYIVFSNYKLSITYKQISNLMGFTSKESGIKKLGIDMCRQVTHFPWSRHIWSSYGWVVTWPVTWPERSRHPLLLFIPADHLLSTNFKVDPGYQLSPLTRSKVITLTWFKYFITDLAFVS